MTMVWIEHSDDWVMADLTADPHEWTRATIRARAGEEKLDLTGQQIELLADVMLPALESARAEEIPPLMVMYLLPRADVPVLANVTVRADAVPEEATLTDLLEELRLPSQMLEQPAQETMIQTRSGEAAHLVQRYRTPVDPEHEIIQEHEAVVWRVTDVEGDLAIFLSTSHLDLVQAATWRPKLVEMASTLSVLPDDPA